MNQWERDFNRRFGPKDWGDKWNYTYVPGLKSDDFYQRKVAREERDRERRFREALLHNVGVTLQNMKWRSRIRSFWNLWKGYKERKFDKALLNYDYSWLLNHNASEHQPSDWLTTDYGNSIEKNLYKEVPVSVRAHKKCLKLLGEVAEGVGIGLLAAAALTVAPELIGTDLVVMGGDEVVGTAVAEDVGSGEVMDLTDASRIRTLDQIHDPEEGPDELEPKRRLIESINERASNNFIRDNDPGYTEEERPSKFQRVNRWNHWVRTGKTIN